MLLFVCLPGNAVWVKMAFFRQHGCTTNDTNAKYNSRAAQMYREKIRQLANAALSKHGTDVRHLWDIRCVLFQAYRSLKSERTLSFPISYGAVIEAVLCSGKGACVKVWGRSYSLRSAYISKRELLDWRLSVTPNPSTPHQRPLRKVQDDWNQ